MVASKRNSSPGLLCSQRAPLLSGGSQCCSAVGCHLPAGCSPAHGTSPLVYPVDKDRKGGMGFALPPFPGHHKRDLPPPNQLCDVDTTYELHTWVRTAAGSGQAILQCPQRWQKAELETMGGSPWQLAAGGGVRQGAAPAEIPRFLTLRPRAAAQGWHQLGLRWEKTGRGDPDTLHVYLAPRSDNLLLCRSPPWDPESSTAGHGVVQSHLSWMSL